jgi:hypothetical protein
VVAHGLIIVREYKNPTDLIRKFFLKLVQLLKSRAL